MTLPHRTLAEVLRPCLDWQRLRTGNLRKRLLNGTIVTVFRRRDGGYGRCVNRPDFGPEFSSDRWETEEDAIESANYWIEEE